MNANKSPPTINYGQFQVRGIVTGTLNEQRFYSEGSKGDSKWRRVQFGVKINHNAFVYVELLGIKSPKVKLVYQDPITKKVDKNNQLFVDYDEIHRVNENYKIHMPVRMNLERNDDCEDTELIAYDAAEVIREKLNEGDSVLITGSLQISEYKDKPQEKFTVNGIYLTDTIEFNSKGYEQQAYFNQEIVYMGMKYDEKNESHKLLSNIIYKKDDGVDFVPYEFTVKDDKVKVITEYFNHVPHGSLIKIHGHVNISVPVKQLDGHTVICGMPIKELIVTGGNVNSLVDARYDDNDFLIMKQGSPFKEVVIEELQELPF